MSIACKGIETSQKLGRHGWMIERTRSSLSGYRRLTIRDANHFLAFLILQPGQFRKLSGWWPTGWR